MICLDDLGITEVAISKLHEGTGHTRCQHGVLPVPVPAVTNIVAQYALPIVITENQGEMITPTGAAIVAAIRTMASPPHGFTIKAVGLGAGKKDFERANILRAMIIDEVSDSDQERIWVLESNIDDSTGEALAYTVESLFKHGARDAFFTPVFMKKNRPANLLTVICDRETMPALETIIFTHTTTIGIRKYPVERTFLPREEISVETACGTGLVKRVKYGEEVYCYPEFESVKALCNKTGIGFQEIYFLLMSEAKKVT